jgi:phosphoglycolate phosphatase
MSTLIFDFDGTLADTFFIAKDIYRTLARGRRPTDEAEIEILRGLSAREVIQHVGARWWQVPYIAWYARREVKRRRAEVKPIAGIAPVVEALHKAGHRLYIVSSNSTRNVQHFIEEAGLGAYFDGVYGGVGLFDKAAAIRKITLHEHVDAADAFYIGDEARDVEAARRAQMPCISVTWGYNNLTGLNRVQAQTIVDTPQELLAVIKKLSPGKQRQTK